MREAAKIGFDRKIRLEWLDAIASKRVAGADIRGLRRFAHFLIQRDHPSEKAHRNTVTVLLQLWADPSRRACGLRDAAAGMFGELPERQRVVLHWGIALATYPFFRDVAASTGRLLGLQDCVSLQQIQRRIAEKWGQRSTVERAAQRVVRSMVDWGTLIEAGQRGTYVVLKPLPVEGRLATWLVEAFLLGQGASDVTMAQLQHSAAFFPFNVRISVHELRRAHQFVVHRQALDEEVIALR